MLQCGVNWRPSKVLFVRDTISTSTDPLHVETDDGSCIAKYVGNRQGDFTLAAELISAELGLLLGLKIPDFALLTADASELGGATRYRAIAPMFCSRFLSGALPFVPSPRVLGRLRDRSALAKLVVFDTWLRNSDRFSASGQNMSNLLILQDKKKLSLWVIDHTHAIVEFETGEELGSDWIEEEMVYGYRAEFLPYLKRSDLLDACRAAAAVDRHQLNEVVGAIPRQWGVGQSLTEELADCLFERAQRLQGWLLAAVLGQHEMDV